ncbi:MAG: tRNA pseudouridine(13) synthase TruD [Candidatus Bathyarchaeia archaeon]
MQQVPEIDQQLGIRVYATKTAGVGGVIRQAAEDFVVEEMLVDGSKATIAETATKPALGASEERQRFLLCVLVKRNWDTFIAVKNIARSLGTNQARVQIAGIKDAKAVTAQFATLEGVSAEEAARVQVRDVELRPVGYFREALCGFYLLGNSFSLAIRDIAYSKATVKKRITSVKDELDELGGIPNFYGHQRFGTTRPITHLVGKAMVKGDLEEAAMLFLAKPSPLEHAESRQARMELGESRDFKRALEAFPKQLRYERLMLRHLADAPSDFAGAFRRLPLKLRMLFVQAYQSLLFNRLLSQRISSGLQLGIALAGDYVVNVERSGLPMVKTGRVVEVGAVVEVNKQIKEGKMRVALPIIGYRQGLSQGSVGDTQQAILEVEGVEPKDFRMSEMPEVGGRGELRAVLCPVRDFKTGAVGASAETPHHCDVRLEFALLKGAYATVLLREVMKPVDPVSAGF